MRRTRARLRLLKTIRTNKMRLRIRLPTIRRLLQTRRKRKIKRRRTREAAVTPTEVQEQLTMETRS